MEKILKGMPAAKAMDEKTKENVELLVSKNVYPTLGILRIGERKDDVAYENATIKRCQKLGINIKRMSFPIDVEQDVVLGEINKFNEDDSIHGILMFRPLPKHLNEKEICDAISADKDVDGVSEISMANVYSGNKKALAPCTAVSCMEMLKFYGVELTGKTVAVIGRSLVIGKPVSMLLQSEDATVIMCHSKTKNLENITKSSDIVVACLGKAEILGDKYFREGQIVIDVGINWSESKQKIVGDVDFDNVVETVEAITPVPAGVGSLTTAVLAKHVVSAALNKIKE